MKNKDKICYSNIKERLKSPSPPFWKAIRNWAIGIGAVSAAIVAAPIALPALLITIASYGIAVGSVAASLATLTKVDTPEDK